MVYYTYLPTNLRLILKTQSCKTQLNFIYVTVSDKFDIVANSFLQQTHD